MNMTPGLNSALNRINELTTKIYKSNNTTKANKSQRSKRNTLKIFYTTHIITTNKTKHENLSMRNT